MSTLERRGIRSRLPARTIDLQRLLDTLLVCAIGTILIIRTQLWLTNYPQLGGHGLHIAHLLWGGLGMLIAIVILVAFLNPVARQIGAVLGGIGLGFFIDELGKFLTSDNNYFFKPTAAIIYIFFILFFLAIRRLSGYRGMSEREYLVNAIELAKDAAVRTMTPDQKQRARVIVAQANQSDPMVRAVAVLIEESPTVPAGKAPFFARVGRRIRDGYLRLTERRWFIRLVTALFVIWALGTLIEVVSLIMTLEPHLRQQETVTIQGAIKSKSGHFTVVEWANIVASLTGGVLVVWGLVRLRRSRVAAYAMFERALLVSIFLTQVFAFIQSQFGAVVGFLIDVLLFYTIRYMLDRERERELGVEPDAGSPAETAPPAGAPA